MTAGRWDRIGAICGLVFVVVFLITFALPVTPDLGDPIEESIADIRDDKTGLLLNFWLGGIITIPFVAFVATVWGRARRIAGAEIPAAALLLSAALYLGVILVVNASFLVLTSAVSEDLSPEAVEAIVALDFGVFIGSGFGFATMFAAFAAVSFAGALPRWLAWLAAAVAVLVAVGLLGVFGSDTIGGIGVLFFIGLPLGLVWILGASIAMLRSDLPAEAAVEPVAATP